MKQVWAKSATCRVTASTTRGSAWPTLATAIPDPRSISWLPSTSSSRAPRAASTYTGRVVPTPAATARALRAASARERGPGTSVSSRRPADGSST